MHVYSFSRKSNWIVKLSWECAPLLHPQAPAVAWAGPGTGLLHPACHVALILLPMGPCCTPSNRFEEALEDLNGTSTPGVRK